MGKWTVGKLISYGAFVSGVGLLTVSLLALVSPGITGSVTSEAAAVAAIAFLLVPSALATTEQSK